MEKEKISDFGPVKELIGEWAYPYRVGGSLPEEVKAEMSEFALQMLHDVARIFGDRMGVLHWVKKTAAEIDPTWDIKLDSEFEVVFPIEDRVGITYLATVARIAQARAVKEIDPSASIGRRSRIRSRRRALVVSSSDIA